MRKLQQEVTYCDFCQAEMTPGGYKEWFTLNFSVEFKCRDNDRDKTESYHIGLKDCCHYCRKTLQTRVDFAVKSILMRVDKK